MMNLIYQKWSPEMGGDGVSGTIRTTPENYYVATVNSDRSLTFEGLEANTRNVDQFEVTCMWQDGKIPVQEAR